MMDESSSIHSQSVSDQRDFLNLRLEPRHMKLLDEAYGFVSGLAKDNLAHQMRFSVERLEEELASAGERHVLQLRLEGGDERTPDTWSLFADGIRVAAGSGDYAFNCFCADARAFLDLCHNAVRAAGLSPLSRHDYDLLRVAHSVAVVEARGLAWG